MNDFRGLAHVVKAKYSMRLLQLLAQRTVERSCFLTPGQNDTCFTDDEGFGVCYCHSDLCNHAARPHAATALQISAAAAALVAAVGRIMCIGR